MTELWLVRHGETDWNREGLYQGQADVPLNKTGLAQAGETAAQIAATGETFTALYSSPLVRSLQTAQITADKLGMPVLVDERLMEINQGEWTGKDYKTIISRFNDPDETDNARADGVRETIYERAPGGESVADVAKRMRAAADEFAHRHPGAKILVFTHGLALSTLYCQANSIPLEETYNYIPRNGKITIVQWGDGEISNR
jgi:broad specificity phosphatase PhoE